MKTKQNWGESHEPQLPPRTRNSVITLLYGQAALLAALSRGKTGKDSNVLLATIHDGPKTHIVVSMLNYRIFCGRLQYSRAWCPFDWRPHLSHIQTPAHTTTITTEHMHPLHSHPKHGNSYINSPEMAQEQSNYSHASASQTMVNQQWDAPTGANIQNNYGPVYLGANAVAYLARHNGPEIQPGGMPPANGSAFHPAVQPTAPGYTHFGHGFGKQAPQQQPSFGGNQVNATLQSGVVHVCKYWQDYATEPEHRAYRELCNHLVHRSNHKRTCDLVGAEVTQKSIALFTGGDKEKAKRDFWRRAQKSDPQRRNREAGKQQKIRAKQPDPDQLRPANTVFYHQQMAGQSVANGNVGGFAVPAVNGMFLGHHPANPMLMTQEAVAQMADGLEPEGPAELNYAEWVDVEAHTAGH